MKENKLTKRLNPIVGDNIAKLQIYKQLFGVRSFLTENTTSVTFCNCVQNKSIEKQTSGLNIKAL